MEERNEIIAVLYGWRELLCSESSRVAASERSNDVSQKKLMLSQFVTSINPRTKRDAAHKVVCFDFIVLIGEEIEAIAWTDPVLTISGISNGNYLVQISIVNDNRATPSSIPL